MKTFRTRRGGVIAYSESGSGTPLLALHGGYSTSHEIRAFLTDPLAGRPVRALYPDLPGMGDSTPDGVRSSDDVLDDLEQLIDERFGAERMLVVGHSYGAHLARGLAARHPERIAALALLCALLPGPLDPAPAFVVRADPGVADDLSPEARGEFEGYLVVRTVATVARFREALLPWSGRYDGAAVERIMGAMELRVDPAQVVVDAPTLIASGRHDSWVGYRRQGELGELYPFATVVTAAGAGHALPHERPELIAGLLADLLDRADVGLPAPGAAPQ